MMKKFGNYLFATLVFLFFVSYINVSAEVCTKFEILDGGFPIHSVTVNGQAWVDEYDQFETNNGNYEIIILAGKNGDKFPDISRPGGLGEVERIINPDSTGEDDKYKLTLTITGYNDGACAFIGGISLMEGPEPQEPETNGNLTIQINGHDLEWHELSDEASHFTFAINDSEMIFLDGNNLTFTKENGKIVSGKTINPINLPYHPAGNTVTFHMHSNASEYIESMTINGVNYNTPKTREELANAFQRDMLCLDFEIANVPKADAYNIVINAIKLEEELTGGFGWNYSSEGDVDAATDRIPHGTIEFVRAVYNGEEYNTIEGFKLANRLFDWHDAIKKDHYSIEEGDRSQFGYTFFPTGTMVTIKIIPDSGYQLVGLRNSGEEFTREEEPGVYTFRMKGGSAALQANFVKIDDEVKADSTIVNGGNISNVAFDNGTSKLEIGDVASMSPERLEEFEKAKNDYEIDKYLELSLYNTIYKGGQKDTNNNYLAWENEIHDLNNKATVEIELKDGLNASSVAVIHEVRDEDNKIMGYDLIEANYDSNSKTVSFETDGFSTYAIATKGSVELPDEEEVEMIKVEFDTRAPEGMEPVEVKKGEKVAKPNDPVNGDMIFVGWFTDDKFENLFDFNTPITKETVLYAEWKESGEHYVVSDDNGNTVEFDEIKDRSYDLTMVDVTKLNDEELKAIGATREKYNEVEKIIIKATSKEGELLSVYKIEITDKEDGHSVVDGPFKIKIKLTGAMKKYNTFKMIYLTDDFEAKDVVELKVEGDYLVGELPHLSIYTLVGSVSNTLPDTPKTGDNIYTWVMILLVSLIVITLSTKYIVKTSKVRIK